ncbi:MAG: DUF333 domain-containing protein [Candidatus Peribacteraceae bacterium]|nr:DUF333 domain-containing protein [Candidatus Peribacteraceae bacterium]
MSADFNVEENAGMANPAAYYCEYLGYEYIMEKTESGESGICVLEENVTECDSWDFFEGKCGMEFSYCTKHGYNIETETDGKNPYSPEYAVCIPKKILSSESNTGPMERIAVTDLIGLSEKISTEFVTENKNPEIVNEHVIKKDLERPETITSIDTNMVTQSLPSTFDWRNKDGENWLTPVKNQGSCGSCWAFAAIGGVESKIKIARNDPNFNVDLSEQDVLSCSGAGNCVYGGSRWGALDFIKDTGVTDEYCFLYAASDSVCSNKCSTWTKRLWKIDDYNSASNDVETIKKYLIEKGPLVVGLYMDGYFDNDNIYRCDNPDSGPHAVTLVGYSDFGNYWIIKNSWGLYWNGDGYFKVGYGECNIEDRGILYLDLQEPQNEELKATNFYVIKGSVSGSLTNTYYNNGNYMTLSEDCFFSNCDGLDVWYNFSTGELNNVASIDLIAKHQARWEDGFGIYNWNRNNYQWDYLGSVPNSKWYLMKYNLCDSKSNCYNYISSGNILIDYYHPSCTWCNQDYVDVDWLYLETTEEGYCSANTSNANYEYITKVELNGNEKNSGISTYSDFTDTIFTTLNVGNEYTLYVNGYTIGNYTEFVKAWIDFDNDKNFSTSEEINLGDAIFEGTHTFGKTFTVPNDSVDSETRMRIYLKFGSSPSSCEYENYGEVEDYKIKIVNDIFAPYVFVPNHGAGYVRAGEPVIINANVYDNYGTSSVYVEIESLDENVIDIIELYDDGMHNDNLENDNIYGNSWVTNGDEKNYYIDFIATDIHGNSQHYDNLDIFTTVPFTSTSRIILIDNSVYISYINYYENALDSNGYSYYLWDSDLRGEIGDNIINSFDLCVWSSPFSFDVPNDNQQLTLSQFLDNGGTLFVSGQDLGYRIGETNFYHDYLYANYVQDNTAVYALDGVVGDPVTNGTDIEILGGDGANNQYWPSEISTKMTTNFTVVRKSTSCGLMCVEYSYHIISSYGESPPYKTIYDNNYPEGSSHLKIIENGGKGIDLVTYENCTCVSSFCGCYHEPGFDKIIYDGTVIELEFCKDTDTGKVCFVNETSVTIEFDLGSVPIFYYDKTSSIHSQQLPLIQTKTVKDIFDEKIPTSLSSLEINEDSSEQIGALRVDNDIHKLVYFAFGFEAINNENDRNMVMRNVVNWLVDLIPPDISIFLPLNNSWHTTGIVFTNVYAGETAKWIKTSIDSTEPIIKCYDCSAVAYNLTDLAEGEHTFTVYASDYSDNIANKTVQFFVDTIHPHIINQMPQDESIIVGSEEETFSITYTEEYLNKIQLYWNETWPYACDNINNCPPVTLSGCTSGLNQICSTTLNLSSYSDGKSLVYYFGIVDLSGKSSYRLPYTLKIDKCIPNWVEVNEYCSPDDTFVEWFNDTNRCYEKTGLGSDNNPPDNNTYSCDYCTPEWVCIKYGICQIGDVKFCELVHDTYNCYAQTNLPSDQYQGNYSESNKTCEYIPYMEFEGMFNTTENQSSVIDSINETNTSLEIFTLSNTTDNSIEIIEYFDNPENENVFGLTSLGKYVSIEVEGEIEDGLEWVIIKLYYTDEEISEAGIDESSLRMYYWNETSQEWEECPNSGVNIEENYVWANMTHLSLYGSYGDLLPYCGDGYCNNGESCSSCVADCGECPPPPPPGGGSPGGGSPSFFVASSTCTEDWSCISWSNCVDGGQSRTCEDLNDCGTTKNKPSETQSCDIAMEKEVAITKVCDSGERKCSENDIIECNSEGSEWVVIQICEHGCSDNECNEKSELTGPPTGLIIGTDATVISGFLVVIVIVVIGGLFYKTKKRKETTKKV